MGIKDIENWAAVKELRKCFLLGKLMGVYLFSCEADNLLSFSRSSDCQQLTCSIYEQVV